MHGIIASKRYAIRLVDHIEQKLLCSLQSVHGAIVFGIAANRLGLAL
jgi:hypothetical protein